MHFRQLGKRPARHDSRVPAMATRMNLATLPPPPAASIWYAAQPLAGIGMVGNDRYGCCVEASIAHYLAAIANYTDPNAQLTPTEADVLTLYTAITGFNPDDPNTDLGTYFMGPGGAVEYWIRNGVTIGGRSNKPEAVVTVNHRDLQHVKQAINMFGFVFTGANMKQADVDSAFLWLPTEGPVIGGHEFLLAGYENVAGHDYFDVITWNGMWRASDDWILSSVDECAAVLNRSFVNAGGTDPAGVAWADLEQDLQIIATA